MPLRGGAANKAGNRYERQWTVLALLDVLAGEAEYVQIEVPGDAGRGTEFVLMRDGSAEWHQVKRQQAKGRWTIASLDSAGVLAHWWPKLEAGGRCVFVSSTSAGQLSELAERAAQAESWTEFDAEFLGLGDHRIAFNRLRLAWGNPAMEATFRALRRVTVCLSDEQQLKERVLDRAARVVDGTPAAVARRLAEIVDDSTHRRLTASDIGRLLAEVGHSRVGAGAGEDREHHAPGTRQAIQDSANVYLSGDRNKVSLRVGQGRSASHLARLSIGLVVVLAVVATAAYLVTQEPSVPEYFQTGPAAGIFVPSAGARCDSTIPDVLISPADNVLTDVSEAHALSLDGRSAMLMQGTLDGTTYKWVISDPDGDYGGMQLRWWVSQGNTHYCTVSLPGGPPAAQTQQGIRQVSSIAVPTVMNGEPVMFEVCVWYTIVRKKLEKCGP